MMVVYCKEGSTLAKVFNRPMLGFRDLEKVRSIHNKISPLMIIATVGKFDVSRILIDGGSFYDIMYTNLFEKIRMNQSSLLLYEGSVLQAFNITIIHPWGYMEMMVSVGNGKSIQIVNYQFIFVPCKSVYNYILG